MHLTETGVPEEHKIKMSVTPSSPVRHSRIGKALYLLNHGTSVTSLIAIMCATIVWRIGRLFSRSVYPALAGRVQLPCFRGFMHLFSDEITIYYSVVVEDIYNLQSRVTVQPDWTIIEVGSHIGFYSIAQGMKLDETTQARLFALEPDPGNFELLERNVRENGLTSRVVPLHYAVSGYDGSVQFCRTQHSQSGHISGYGNIQGTHLHSDGEVVLTVPTITLDTLVQRWNVTHVDLLKINAEGAEMDILKGSSLALRTIRRIVLSVEGRVPAEVLSQYLHQFGFRQAARRNGLYLFINQVLVPEC